MSHNGEPNVGELQKPNLVEFINDRRQWLENAVDINYGPDHDGELTDLLPEPTQPRSDALGWDLNSEQEDELRNIARKFGIGAEEDLPSGADVELLEGGKPWKIMSEFAIANLSKTVYFAGTPFRVTGEDEQAFMERKYGQAVEGESEYDMVKRLIAGINGFEANQPPTDLGFGYEVTQGHELVQQNTGQFLELGTLDGCSIVIVRVDQENLEEGKYRNRPGTLDLAKVMSSAMRANGDSDSSIGIISSNTYSSRAVDTVTAGVEDGRSFMVGMYGRNTLARLIEDVPEANVPKETPINQIPSELRVIADSINRLEKALDQS